MDFSDADARCRAAACRLAILPVKDRPDKLAQELEAFSPHEKESARSYIALLVAKLESGRLERALDKISSMTPAQQSNCVKATGFIIGVLGMAAIFVTAFFLKTPSSFQYFVFRSVFSLSAAGFAGALTGFISVRGKMGPFVLAASASFAVFAIIYFVNPPDLFFPELKQERRQVAPVKG